MATPVLATKLYIPPPPPKAVLRPRLVERLNEGLHRKLTLLSAPAGFGKTTLVSEWVAGCDRQVAWLSLDEGDNDPTRFLAYLMGAIQMQRPAIGQELLAALQSPQPPPVEHVVRSLINQLAAAQVPLVVVLDDYHVITNAAIHAALTLLVDYLPPQMTLILLTRTD